MTQIKFSEVAIPSEQLERNKLLTLIMRVYSNYGEWETDERTDENIEIEVLSSGQISSILFKEDSFFQVIDPDNDRMSELVAYLKERDLNLTVSVFKNGSVTLGIY